MNFKKKNPKYYRLLGMLQIHLNCVLIERQGRWQVAIESFTMYKKPSALPDCCICQLFLKHVYFHNFKDSI